MHWRVLTESKVLYVCVNTGTIEDDKGSSSGGFGAAKIAGIAVASVAAAFLAVGIAFCVAKRR